jgi:hypothetical protein
MSAPPTRDPLLETLRQQLELARALLDWGPDHRQDAARHLYRGWHACACARAQAQRAAQPPLEDFDGWLNEDAQSLDARSREAWKRTLVVARACALGSCTSDPGTVEVSSVREHLRLLSEAHLRLRRGERTARWGNRRWAYGLAMVVPAVALMGIVAHRHGPASSPTVAPPLPRSPSPPQAPSPPVSSVAARWFGDDPFAVETLVVDVGGPAGAAYTRESHGWSAPFTDAEGRAWRWALKPESLIDLPLRPNLASKITLLATVATEQLAQIVLNGAELATVKLRPGVHLYSLVLPAGEVRERNQVALRWTGDRSTSPEVAQVFAFTVERCAGAGCGNEPSPVEPVNPRSLEALVLDVGSPSDAQYFADNVPGWAGREVDDTGSTWRTGLYPESSIEFPLVPDADYDLRIVAASAEHGPEAPRILFNGKLLGQKTIGPKVATLDFHVSKSDVKSDNRLTFAWIGVPASAGRPAAARIFGVALRRAAARK